MRLLGLPPPARAIVLPQVTLRAWCSADAAALPGLANDEDIARNLRDLFPHPYLPEHAERWVAHITAQPSWIFAMEVDGALAGGIGLHPFDDVYRYGAELGYWLARRHWGKGIATAAVSALVESAFTHTEFVRLQAGVFSWNRASMRVLEKAGFQLEGIRRRAVVKGDQLGDEHIYVRLRP